MREYDDCALSKISALALLSLFFSFIAGHTKAPKRGKMFIYDGMLGRKPGNTARACLG